MRKALALGTVALSFAGLAVTAAPAQAVDGTTTVALTVVDGTLAIVTAPAGAAATSSLVGTSRTVTSNLGLTTITDTRAASTGWTLSATTTDFTRAAAGLVPAATIAASNAKFSLTAPPTTLLGSATYTTTTQPSSSGTLAVSSASGVNTATMTPVLTVAVPNSAGTGLYTGTVTQSVV